MSGKLKARLTAFLMVCVICLTAGGGAALAAERGPAGRTEQFEAVAKNTGDPTDLEILDLTLGYDPDNDTSDNAKAAAMMEFFYDRLQVGSSVYSETLASGWSPVYRYVTDESGQYQVELLAYYPLITEDEAWQMLLDGYYINQDATFTPDYYELMGLEMEIAYNDVQFLENGGTWLLIPYYSFTPSKNGQEYNDCLVPAVDPAYLSGKPWHGSIIPGESIGESIVISEETVPESAAGNDPESNTVTDETGTSSVSAALFPVFQLLAFLVGLAVLILGIRILPREGSRPPKIMQHGLRKVSPENRIPYCRKAGTGMIVSAAALLLLSLRVPIILRALGLPGYFLCTLVLVIGFIFMFSALKYKK